MCMSPVHLTLIPITPNIPTFSYSPNNDVLGYFCHHDNSREGGRGLFWLVSASSTRTYQWQGKCDRGLSLRWQEHVPVTGFRYQPGNRAAGATASPHTISCSHHPSTEVSATSQTQVTLWIPSVQTHEAAGDIPHVNPTEWRICPPARLIIGTLALTTQGNSNSYILIQNKLDSHLVSQIIREPKLFMSHLSRLKYASFHWPPVVSSGSLHKEDHCAWSHMDRHSHSCWCTRCWDCPSPLTPKWVSSACSPECEQAALEAVCYCSQRLQNPHGTGFCFYRISWSISMAQFTLSYNLPCNTDLLHKRLALDPESCDAQ